MSGILTLAEKLQQKSKSEAESINLELEKGFQMLKNAINMELKNGERTLSNDIEAAIERVQLTSQQQIEKRLAVFKSYQTQAEHLLDRSLQEIQSMAQTNEQQIRAVLNKNSKLTAISIFRTWLIPLGFVLIVLFGMIGYGAYQVNLLTDTYQEIRRAKRTLAALDDQTNGITIQSCTSEGKSFPCVELDPKFKSKSWTDQQTGATLQIIQMRK